LNPARILLRLNPHGENAVAVVPSRRSHDSIGAGEMQWMP
jgi:hypothetical protein